MEQPPAREVVLVEGAWSHRVVSANGARFHIAEAGAGPLIVLLHGFPEFWWSWRHQLVALAAAGYHAVAPDLRGYGGSDKPPRGYDLPTLAADVAGLVRALGERDAVLAGHDWGGALAWTAASLYPDAVRALVALNVPHPLRMRAAMLTDGAQRRASRYMLGFQRPWVPERQLVRNHGEFVAGLLHAWSGPGWPDPETERRCRDAIGIPGVAHSALEYYRWVLRSAVRPDGVRFARQLRENPVLAPTLQLHGALDSCVLPETAAGSGRYVRGHYEQTLLEGVGHFPHQEAPAVVTAELLRWAAGS